MLMTTLPSVNKQMPYIPFGPDTQPHHLSTYIPAEYLLSHTFHILHQQILASVSRHETLHPSKQSFL